MTKHQHDDDATTGEGQQVKAPPPANLLEAVPPIRTFVVRRIKPTSHAQPEIEEIVVEAHLLQIEAPSIVWFTDIVVDAQRGALSNVHRVFFDVLDVEEVLRAPQGVIFAH